MSRPVIRNKWEMLNVFCLLGIIFFLIFFAGFQSGKASGATFDGKGTVRCEEPTYFQKHVLGKIEITHPLCR
jgi:hypothetical protein